MEGRSLFLFLLLLIYTIKGFGHSNLENNGQQLLVYLSPSGSNYTTSPGEASNPSSSSSSLCLTSYNPCSFSKQGLGKFLAFYCDALAHNSSNTQLVVLFADGVYELDEELVPILNSNCTDLIFTSAAGFSRYRSPPPLSYSSHLHSRERRHISVMLDQEEDSSSSSKPLIRCISKVSTSPIQITTSPFPLLGASSSLVSFAVSNMDFENCTLFSSLSDQDDPVSLWGGGVFLIGTNVTSSFDNCSFSENQASSGGAIFFSGTSLFVSNSNFTSNRAIVPWLGQIGDGGAITVDSVFYNSSSSSTYFINTFTINNCFFFNNTVIGPSSFGGAIGRRTNDNTDLDFAGELLSFTSPSYSFSITTEELSNAQRPPDEITNSIFLNNTAISCKRSAGGAVYNSNSLNIASSVFDFNTAMDCSTIRSLELGPLAMAQLSSGGAVMIENPNPSFQLSATITDSQFDYNFVNGSFSTSGGALCLSWVDLYLSNSNFFQNTAMTIAMYGYSAHRSFGGAIAGFQFTDDNSRGRLVISGGNFSSNIASGGTSYNCFNEASGGVGCSAGSNVGGDAIGGAIAWNAIGEGLTSNCSLDEEFVIDISEVTFLRNRATGGKGDVGGQSFGGGVYIGPLDDLNGTCQRVRNSVFIANFATGGDSSDGDSSQSYGGAAFGGGLYSNYPTEVLGSEFSSNKVQGGGGPNAGTSTGGAIFSRGLLVDHSRFSWNKADSNATEVYGGAVYATHHEVIVKSSGFFYNTATSEGGDSYGGAMVCNNVTNIWIISSTFADSMAKGGSLEESDGAAGGGALFLVASKGILISNCSFYSNQAVAGGVSSTSDDISEISIGGAIYMSLMDIMPVITESTFDRCRAGSGGAVFTNAPLLMQSTFTENQALRGGALYVSPQGGYYYTPPNIITSTFRFNTAVVAGGAIFLEGSVDPQLVNSIFENNTAAYGSTMSCTPAKLVLLSAGPTLPFTFSGETLSFILELQDCFGQTVIDPSLGVQARLLSPIHNTSQTHFTTGIQRDSVFTNPGTGYFNFFKASVTSPPNILVTIGFYLISPSDENVTLSQTYQLTTLGCPPNYFLSTDGTICEPCPTNTYSFNSSSSLCTACPLTDSATQCLHGYKNGTFIIGEGFQPSNWAAPDELIPCANSACQSATCVLTGQKISPFSNIFYHDWESDDDDDYHNHNDDVWEVVCFCNNTNPVQNISACCELGYTSRLCTQCSCDEHACYYSFDEECLPCNLPSTKHLIIFAVAISVSVILLFIINNPSLFFLIEICVAVLLASIGPEDWWSTDLIVVLVILYLVTNNKVSTGLLKIGMNQLQTLTMLPILWPNWLDSLFNRLSSVNLRFSGVACFWPSVLGNPVGSVVFSMTLPLFLSLGAIGGTFGHHACKGAGKKVSKFFRGLLPDDEEGEELNEEALFNSVPLEEEEENERNGRRPRKQPAYITKLIRRSLNHSQLKQLKKRTERRDKLLSTLSTASLRADSFGTDHSINNKEVEVSKSEEEQENEKKAPEEKTPIYAKALHAVLFLLFIGYFDLANDVFSVLRQCDDHNYMSSYPWIYCEDQPWLTMMIISAIGLVLYVIGVPALYMAILWKHRGFLVLDEDEREGRTPPIMAKSLSFLYECYRCKFWWFEMIWMLRRLLLAAALSLADSDSPLQPLFITTILATSVLVQFFTRPFLTKMENRMEMASGFILLFTSSTGTNLFAFSYSTSREVTSTILLVVNVVYLLFVVYFAIGPAVRENWKKFKSGFFKLRKKINKCCWGDEEEEAEGGRSVLTSASFISPSGSSSHTSFEEGMASSNGNLLPSSSSSSSFSSDYPSSSTVPGGSSTSLFALSRPESSTSSSSSSSTTAAASSSSTSVTSWHQKRAAVKPKQAKVKIRSIDRSNILGPDYSSLPQDDH